jgi:hypothetical protein
VPSLSLEASPARSRVPSGLEVSPTYRSQSVARVPGLDSDERSAMTTVCRRNLSASEAVLATCRSVGGSKATVAKRNISFYECDIRSTGRESARSRQSVLK